MTSAGVEGGAQLVATLNAARDDIENLNDPATQAGDALVKALQAEAPRKTGFLASNIGATVEASDITVIAGAPYAAAVNALDPFKERALNAATQTVLDIYTQGVTDAVDQIQGA